MNVLLCMGSRPDIVRMAPLYHVLKQTALQPVVVHAGHDHDALWALYDFFEIEPAHRLTLQCKRPTLAHLSAVLMDQFDRLLARVPAGAALVHGNSAAALALAQVASYHRIPVGHLPADLPADSRLLAFPEAQHRAMLAALASWHFAATPETVKYLQGTGCPDSRIFYVRNTIVDAAQWGLQHLLAYSARRPDGAAFFAGDLIKRLQGGRVVLVNTQRREHDAAVLAQIAQALCVVVEAHADVRVVWPAFGRADVRGAIREAAAVLDPAARARLIPLDAPGYPQLLWLMKQAWLVVTDTPDLQEEAATMKVPALVLHASANGPERAEAGGRALLRVEPNAIYLWISRLLGNPEQHRRMATADNPFGDGRACHHIARILRRELAAAFPSAEAPEPAAPLAEPSACAA